MLWGTTIITTAPDERDRPLTQNRRVVLASRPDGAPVASDFRLESAPVPSPAQGEVLLRSVYLSLDPYLRGRMGPGLPYGSSAPSMALGETVSGGTVCVVVESRDPAHAPGDLVLGAIGWQEHGVQAASALRSLDPTTAPVSTALGVLGMPGFTGYAGLQVIGRPQPGETVVVAAAAGPVGSVVGQVARLAGARAVGIAGSEAKRAWLREVGFDAVVDHRDANFEEQLAEATPHGIDVYFENVGGRVFDAVIPRLNTGARVPVCGLVGDYNGPTVRPPVDHLPALMSAVLSRGVLVQGFAFPTYVAEHHDEFLRLVGGWVDTGRLRYREDVVPGLEAAPDAFVGLLAGASFGKLLVQVSPDPTSTPS